MKQAKISLTQAMQIATQSVSGKIIEAEFDLDNGLAVYEINIAKGTQIHKLVIDSMTGKIISNRVKINK